MPILDDQDLQLIGAAGLFLTMAALIFGALFFHHS